MSEDISVKTRVVVLIDTIKFGLKVMVFAAPLFVALGVWMKSEFVSYMEARDEVIAIEMTEGISNTTLMLWRKDMKEYNRRDSLMFKGLLEDHFVPATKNIGRNVVLGNILDHKLSILEKNIMSIDSTLIVLKYGNRDVVEAELEWYKLKEKKEMAERDIFEAVDKVKSKNDSLLNVEILNLRKAFERSGISVNRINK